MNNAPYAIVNADEIEGMSVVRLLVVAGLARSGKEAKRMLGGRDAIIQLWHDTPSKAGKYAIVKEGECVFSGNDLEKVKRNKQVDVPTEQWQKRIERDLEGLDWIDRRLESLEKAVIKLEALNKV